YIDFHGDESNHIYMTRDYVTAFVERQPQQLTPLLDENGEYITFYHQLRLIDAPLHGYFMGFAWHLSGLSERDLPAKAWRWDGDFGSNLAEGAMPSESMLFNARAASTFLLCLSVMV